MIDVNQFIDGQAKSDPVPEGKRNQIWDKVYSQNEAASIDDFNRAMAYVSKIIEFDRQTKSRTYDLCDVMYEFKEQKLYKYIGYDTFNEWAKDKSVCPFGRSTAQRRYQVGKFMREFNMQSPEFDEEFYEVTGTARDVVYDGDEIDEAATRKNSRVLNRVNVKDMQTIAGLFNKEEITRNEVWEALRLATEFTGDDLREKLNELMGVEDEEPKAVDTDPQPELGPAIAFELSLASSDKDTLASELRALAIAVEQGSFDGKERLESADYEVLAKGKATVVASGGHRFVIFD